jgi:dihydrolipoamide dehydrogenase
VSAFDLVVIGSGPGGYVAAIRASQLRMKVAIVERERLGGVCLNWGCIPTKAILSAAERFDDVRRGAVPGLRATGIEPDYGAVIDASRAAADRLHRGVGSLMKKHKIEVVPGLGRLAGSGQVSVDSEGSARELQGERILIATGSTEIVLPGVEVDGERVLTSREALEHRRLPRSLLVVGAGAVGLEFAYSYSAYGTEVTLIEMADQVLPGFDADCAEAIAQSFSRRKIKVMTRTAYKGLEHNGDGVAVTVEGEKGEEQLQAEAILFGVGRRALVDTVGAQEAGLAIEKGFLKVDERYRTSVEGVFAIGDVIGPPLLAHKASEEGVAAVEFMAGERKRPLDYRLVPANIYCRPQIASVGLSEATAREAGHDVMVGKVPYLASGKAVAAGHTEGFVKLVADRKYGEILGGQIVGAEATDLIAEIAMCMVLESTTRELGDACHAHPTLSELVKEAALAAEGRSLNF